MEEGGVALGDAADGAKRRVHLLSLDQEAINAGNSYSERSGAVYGGHQLVIDAACEDFQHGVQGFGCSDAEASDEGAGDAALGQVAGHLLAATVDDGDFVTRGPRAGDLPRQAVARVRRIEQGAAEFDHQFHSSPSVSGLPSIRFMFCMACPAAPLTRLSMTLTTTARLVRASKVTPISQKLVRATPARSGMCRGLKRRTKGSAAYWCS